MPNAHTSLVNACIALITARGGFAFKLQTGVLPVAGRFVHAGKPGVPDVIGCWPWCSLCASARCKAPTGYCSHSPMGRMIAVECKTGSGRLSAVQKRVHEELSRRGALVVTVRNVAELEEALR